MYYALLISQCGPYYPVGYLAYKWIIAHRHLTSRDWINEWTEYIFTCKTERVRRWIATYHLSKYITNVGEMIEEIAVCKYDLLSISRKVSVSCVINLQREGSCPSDNTHFPSPRNTIQTFNDCWNVRGPTWAKNILMNPFIPLFVWLICV